MKRHIVVLVILILAVSTVVAGIHIYDRVPPPLEMIDAYPLAIRSLGTNASQYHCMTVMPIVTEAYETNHLGGEWAFTFMTTNQTRKYVWVFFDKTTIVMDNYGGGF